jgi:preprotein translocase subunit SecE
MNAKSIPTSIGRFFREIWAELKRVTWPTWAQLRLYTAVVIGSVIVIAAILSLFDLLLAKGLVTPLFAGK